MKRKPANFTINLVPQDPFFDTILGKTLKWALSVGRYIVIFTELIVITSFGARFTLDRQITDLNDAIFRKQAVIESYGDLEGRMRMAQSKIEQYQQLEERKNIIDVFPSLSEITPRDVKLTELIIKPTSISLAGSTLSQASLNLLINNIQLSPSFHNVVVDRIEATPESDNQLFFRLRADTETALSQPASTNNARSSSNNGDAVGL